MRLQKVVPLFIGILIPNLTFTSMAQSVSKVQFSLVYTNDVLGEVEPCG
jgi:hypothetical protein